MKVEILREKRKTIVLKIIDEKTAVLKVPLKLSEKKINEFLQSKSLWLEKNVKKITSKSVTCTVKKLKHGKKYYFKARAYAKSSSGKTIYGAYSSIKGRKF